MKWALAQSLNQQPFYVKGACIVLTFVCSRHYLEHFSSQWSCKHLRGKSAKPTTHQEVKTQCGMRAVARCSGNSFRTVANTNHCKSLADFQRATEGPLSHSVREASQSPRCAPQAAHLLPTPPLNPKNSITLSLKLKTSGVQYCSPQTLQLRQHGLHHHESSNYQQQG